MSYVAKNRSWLEAYVRQLQDAMELSHWRISLIDDAPRDGCSASTDISTTYLFASLMIDDPTDEPEPDSAHALRRIIAHELMHLHVHDWTQAVEDIEEHLNPAAWHLVEKQMFRCMERTVDSIGRAWAESLPLPIRETDAGEEAA